MSLETNLLNLLLIFALAAGVSILVETVIDYPYTIALLIAGFIASLAHVPFHIELSHDIILLVLLPPLLFEGAATTDFEAFRRNLLPITLLAIPGLIVSVAALGWVSATVFGMPLLVALLFATIILPTDPVSVLALFDELGAPERLAVLVEGESLINDGVGVVLFTTLLTLITNGYTSATLTDPTRLSAIAADIGVSVVGGMAIGGLLGYAIYSVMRGLDDHRTEIVLTFLLAYSSFLIAEHYFHVSGVVATVVAGLFIGNRGAAYAMSAQTKISIFDTLDTSAFIVNTFIFLAIGITTPLRQILAHIGYLVPALVFVLAARALAVYPFTMAANQALRQPVSRAYQHVMLWGGLHASIPIALVLGLPKTLSSGQPFPFYEEIRVMVFGVAAFSLVVQGLTMRPLIDRLGIATQSEEEELYELLVGRARAVDAVLDTAEELDAIVDSDTYDRFRTEYETEKAQLNAAISDLLAEYPYLREREGTMFERQLLQLERSAVKDAELDGRISTDVADALEEEINVKLEQVAMGDTTVQAEGAEGYREFWKDRVATVLDTEVSTVDPADSPVDD